MRPLSHALVCHRSRPHTLPFSGHCYLMQDDLQKAYAAYQQALYFLPNPKVCRRLSPFTMF